MSEKCFDRENDECSSDPVSYCFCLGTWRTTLPSLLSRSYEYFWWKSCEYKGHLLLLAWSKGNSLCDYSTFLFFCSGCLGKVLLLSWQSHRIEAVASLLLEGSFWGLWWVRNKLLLYEATEIWGLRYPSKSLFYSNSSIQRC